MGLRRLADATGELPYFVTTSVVDHVRVFTEDRYCQILIDNIKFYQNAYHYHTRGYVIMPSHFHWVLKIDPAYGTISDIMRDIKKFTAWDMFGALRAFGRIDFLGIFKQAAAFQKGQKMRFWEKRFDDEILRNQEMFRAKLEYIHDNPVEAGLVSKAEEYKFSSAKNYCTGDHSILQVDTSFVI